MTDGVSLSHLHETPWTDVKGAYIEVEIEIDSNPLTVPALEYDPDNVTYERREGDLVGRANGTGLYYDSDRGENIPTPIGTKVYLDTPQDTVLEVATDKSGNTLVNFQPPEGVSDE